jgi:hypothetical protein
MNRHTQENIKTEETRGNRRIRRSQQMIFPSTIPACNSSLSHLPHSHSDRATVCAKIKPLIHNSYCGCLRGNMQNQMVALLMPSRRSGACALCFGAEPFSQMKTLCYDTFRIVIIFPRVFTGVLVARKQSALPAANETILALQKRNE